MDSIKHMLSMPWNTPVFTKTRYYYAFGNTPMEDLLEDYKIGGEVDFLLLGAGDIRHVLCTVHGLKEKRPRPTKLTFVMNDADTCIIARDVLLFEIVATINAKDDDDLAFLWAVWYNINISENHRRRLNAILERLCQSPFRSTCYIEFANSATLHAAVQIWKRWKETLSRELVEILRKRKQFISDRLKNCQHKKDGNTEYLVGVSCQKLTREHGCSFHDDPDCIRYGPEVTAWMNKGFTDLPGVQETRGVVNTTLLRPGTEDWDLHYALCPYDCYAPFERGFLEKHDTLTQACFAKLQSIVVEFKQFLSKPGKLKFKFYENDAMALCSVGLPKGQQFDVIHCNNLLDYTGFLNLILCCTPRLKSNTSVLMTETMLWPLTSETVFDFVHLNLGCHPLLMPTVYGIQLAENLDLGTSIRPTTSEVVGLCNSTQRLLWSKAPDDSPTPVQVSGSSSEICWVINRVMKQCFCVCVGEGDQPCMSSPLTMLRLLLQLKHRVKEPLDFFLEKVNSHLPSLATNCSPFQTAWRALLRAHGVERFRGQGLLEVKVTLPLNLMCLKGAIWSLTAQWSLVASLVIFEDLEDAEVFFSDCEDTALLSFDSFLRGLSLEPATGKKKKSGRRAYANPIHIFNNFVSKEESNFLTVKFLVNEEDWAKMPSGSVIQAYTRQKIQPYTIPVDLKMDAVTSKVNLEDFGPLVDQLKRGQMKKNQNCCRGKEQVVVVTEEKDQYKVEIDLVKTEEQVTLDAKFLPEEHPTQLVVKACTKRKTLLTKLVNFSSCISPSGTKIQFSRKRGFISCTVSKDILANEGPSRLPLRDIQVEKLPVMDDIEGYLTKSNGLGMMFVNPKDMATKSTPGFSQDAFFQLRETLQSLWIHVFRHSGVLLHLIITHAEPSSECLGLICTGCYVYKNGPMMALICVDYEVVRELVAKGDLDMGRVEQFLVTASLRCPKQGPAEGVVVRTRTLPQERVLLRKLLYANSRRLPQCKSVGKSRWWYNTFVQLLYPRRRGRLGEISSAMPTNNNEETNVCSACKKTWDRELKKCAACKSSRYCDIFCQKRHWPLHKAECRKRRQ